MSNALVGQVYAKIIDQVIENSHVDFEEDGVSQETLEELKRDWQQRLTQTKCAQFPWEPAPELNQVITPPTVPSNAGPSQDVSTPGVMTPSTPLASNVASPRIKTEPTYDTGIDHPHGHPQPELIAAAQLERMYGPSAAPSIAQLQAQAQAQALHMPAHQHPESLQKIKQEPRMPQDLPPQYRPPQHNSALGKAQTDGSSDDAFEEWKAYAARKRAEAAEIGATASADCVMRQNMRHIIQRLEAGGLLLPLEERCASSQVPMAKSFSSLSSTTPCASNATKESGISQVDGVSDDEDAINSDLDDPEDNALEEEGESGPGQVMVCTYDKVQRVKNKWKCTLKDGLLTCDGKEYVFHKANGEFEW